MAIRSLGWWLLLTLLLACSTTAEAPDTFEVVLVDVVSFGSADAVSTLDTIAAVDQLAVDSPPPFDMVADVKIEDADTGPLADVPSPDVYVPPDVVDLYSPPDIQLPDIGTVDAGACGQCPAATPVCQQDKCICNGTSCPGGFYCKGGECKACLDDVHCGPTCESCASMGIYCKYDGSKCVTCDQNHSCPPGNKCIDGDCAPCEGMGLCGPNCVQCPAGAPLCVSGACECDGSSCGEGALCENGSCVTCGGSDADHCGPQCDVCDVPIPHCLGGTCAFCNVAKSCGPNCESCGEATPFCRPDGASCAECLADGDCGSGFKCVDYTCQENCKAAGCNNDLSASGEKCSQAFIVGRTEALATFAAAGDTYQDGNDDDLNYFLDHSECWDASYDHFYRIYLMVGDVIAATVVPNATEFDVMLKLYDGTECDDDSAGIFSANDKYLVKCWNDASDNKPESFTWTADKQGWFTVVVDGRQSGEDADWGDYNFTLKLSCVEENCCCL